FPLPAGKNLDDHFAEVVRNGLKKRLAAMETHFAAKKKKHEPQEYWDRLEREIEIIKSMGFPGYFLVVWDFIKYAKDSGIPVGPGRGSAAGSLVAYSMGITDVDPLDYDLLFERFLNPERISMPDIDIDFCMNRRGEVINYVRGKYGKENVAQIITFGTMAAKYVLFYLINRDEIVTQYDMRVVEKMGLLKMDFLGLRTLTVIDDAVKSAKAVEGLDIDVDSIPLDDPDVFRLFQEGRTKGVFQF